MRDQSLFYWGMVVTIFLFITNSPVILSIQLKKNKSPSAGLSTEGGQGCPVIPEKIGTGVTQDILFYSDQTTHQIKKPKRLRLLKTDMNV